MGPPVHAWVLLLVGAGLCALALVTFLLGLWFKRTTRWWKRHGVPTPGRCVRIKESEEETTYFVQYLDRAGGLHETHTQASVVSMSLGEVVEVYVDSSNPSHARIAAELAHQHAATVVLAAVFGGLGVLTFALGSVFWVVG